MPVRVDPTAIPGNYAAHIPIRRVPGERLGDDQKSRRPKVTSISARPPPPSGV